MRRKVSLLYWLGDQIERGVPADRADLTSFETLSYRLSQRVYKIASNTEAAPK
jgi:hypothetical protein